MTARRPSPVPAAVSPIGQAAAIRVQAAPLKVGDKLANDRGDHQEEEARLFETDEPSPPKRPVRPGRTRGGRRPPPAASDAIPTTIRFDVEEAAEIDLWLLALREAAGRRTLDKSEVIRELLRLAREHDPTYKALLRRIR
ncbi:hypothetical protein [Streptomyces sp. NPDC094049]|uniref:hypothetical protein n=1 Tax=Streptomyces sp. NPDC094049 TaxID=3154987 RepID=UPI00331A2E31